MDSTMIHGLWQIVESTHVNQLLETGDHDLVQFLTEQMGLNRELSEQEVAQIQNYIGDRIPLIRDLARGGF